MNVRIDMKVALEVDRQLVERSVSVVVEDISLGASWQEGCIKGLIDKAAEKLADAVRT